jgi:hypothetical protein
MGNQADLLALSFSWTKREIKNMEAVPFKENSSLM